MEKRMDNATFVDKNGIERFRQPVAAYGRVMGYVRGWLVPTQEIKGGDIVTDENRNKKIFSNGFNLGKMSERSDRKYYTLGHECPRNFDKVDSMILDNQRFVQQFA